eukprot:351187_1
MLTAFILLLYASNAIPLYRIKSTRVLPVNASIFSTTTLPNGKVMATIGNGYVATPIGSNTVYISGVYNGNDQYQSSNVSHRARIPSLNSISLSFPNTNNISHYYTLDINDAVFYDSYIPKSNLWQVEQLRYAHRTNMNLLVNQIYINNSANNNPLNMKITVNKGNPSSDINFRNITCPNQSINKDTLCQTGNTLNSEGNYSTIQVGVINTNIPNNLTIPPKTIITYYYATVFLTSLESNSVANDMVSLYNKLYSNKEQWLILHLDEWTNIWQNGRIDIIGNNSDASNVYASLYYTISSIRHDWYHGLSPGSLSSDGYHGHIFWDSCTWMYPPLLMLYESLGFSVLQYRYETIPGARINANITGFDLNVLRYPWEAAFSGIEVCPPGASEGKREIHINADIGLAIKQYFYATQNLTWLKQIGYPMLEGISNFFTQRVYYNETSKLYGYIDVCPPDESHGFVNNSIYTNNGAQVVLNFTIEAAKMLNISYSIKWETIATNMYIPFDPIHNYHPEFDGYKIGTIVKQADVILLSYPWQFQMADEIHVNDLLLYENATNQGGPEMTWSMFVINWIGVGHYKRAMQYYNISYVSIQKPFKIWTETANGGGTVNFITGAGGYLQSFIFGFGGLRLFDAYLLVNFTFIPWTQMNLIGIDYKYNSINFNMYNDTSMDITVVYRNQEINNQLVVTYFDNNNKITLKLNVNKTVNIPAMKHPLTIS